MTERELSFKDPGPDLSPPPPVRPRTQAEAHPAREALRKLSDALLRHEHPLLRVDGRRAWLLSVLPLSTPEEIGDAISLAGKILSRLGEPIAYRGMLLTDEQRIRQAVLGALSALGSLVDDMREEAEEQGTDRRRSVPELPIMAELVESFRDGRPKGWTANHFAVLSCLLAYYPDIWPRAPTIAFATSLELTVVYACLNDLERWGVAPRDREPRARRKVIGPNDAPNYAITRETIAAMPREVDDPREERRQKRKPRGGRRMEEKVERT